jgi:hypothetical protein
VSSLLEPAQKKRLLAAKNAWQEGERALDALAEQATLRQLFAQIQIVLQNLRRLRESNGENNSDDSDDAAHAKSQLLPLVRRLSPVTNPALGRPSVSSLARLLYDDAPVENRLFAFLTTEPVGIQTAMHWLHAAFPEVYPLLTPLLKSVLRHTRRQRHRARQRAQERFPTAHTSLLPLLTEIVFYDAIKETLGVASYAEVNAILRHATERGRSPQPLTVREEVAPYGTQNDTLVPAPTDADVIAYLEAYIAAKGFHFPPLAVASYYLALKAKPFVILAGLSGTGKTRLTTLLAEALTAKTLAQYLLLPVRPDWTDPTPLLGYFNPLTQRYQRTVFLDFLTEASRPENQHHAFFVCLDEMNLARVEHYFADLLSAMETEERQLLLGENLRLHLPPNLFITGSVNVDEASYPFSRKVIDRANVLEFASVDLAYPLAPPTKTVLPSLTPQECQRVFLTPCPPVSESQNHDTIATLTAINQILTPAGQHFGYRVRDEILRYLACADGILPADTALDLQLLQKVLPRLSGIAEVLLPVLNALHTYIQTRFPMTAQKITQMRIRAESLGFVTFFD